MDLFILAETGFCRQRGAVQVLVCEQLQADTGNLDVVEDVHLIRNAAFFRDRSLVQFRQLNDDFRFLRVGLNVNHRGDQGGNSARCARLPQLGGCSRQVQWFAGLAVRNFHQELVGVRGVGKAAIACYEAADVQCNTVEAHVIDGIDLHQQILAFGFR